MSTFFFINWFDIHVVKDAVRNICRVLDTVNVHDVPVYRGATQPLGNTVNVHNVPVYRGATQPLSETVNVHDVPVCRGAT